MYGHPNAPALSLLELVVHTLAEEEVPARRASKLLEQLPDDHRQLLDLINGGTTPDGHLRLLGTRRGEPHLDLDTWNGPTTWKDAWAGHDLASWLCFGENGWGDQYAYPLDATGCRRDDTVWYLDHTTMTPTRIADTFLDFLTHTWLVEAATPSNPLTVAALTKGPLRPERHWLLIPHESLGGPRSATNIIAGPAVGVLVHMGDIDAQRQPGKTVQGTTNSLDDSGRIRIQLHYQPAASSAPK